MVVVVVVDIVAGGDFFRDEMGWRGWSCQPEASFLTADATGIRQSSWPALGLVCNPGTRRLRNHFTFQLHCKVITI